GGIGLRHDDEMIPADHRRSEPLAGQIVLIKSIAATVRGTVERRTRSPGSEVSAWGDSSSPPRQCSANQARRGERGRRWNRRKLHSIERTGDAVRRRLKERAALAELVERRAAVAHPECSIDGV